MLTYQVKYWFDTNSREHTGEFVIETVQAPDALTVGRRVEEHLSRQTFAITPAFGPAQDGGMVIVHSPLVRYVEILPSGKL